jgi:hypothetical protein
MSNIHRSKARKPVTKRRNRPTREKAPRNPEEIFPELKTLPFVRYLGGPPGTDQCDWWCPPVGKPETLPNGLDQEFQGALYALQTIRHMTEHPNRYHVLNHIMEAMIKKGTKRKTGLFHDPIAHGFIGAISAILIRAERSGVATMWALATASHMEAHKNDRGLGKDVRKILERTIAARRAFADRESTHENANT